MLDMLLSIPLDAKHPFPISTPTPTQSHSYYLVQSINCCY